MHCTNKYDPQVNILTDCCKQLSRMERYGFFLCDSDRELEKFTYLHGVLFKDAFECVEIARDWKAAEKRFYFKILNNSEIVKFIHDKETKKVFGYVFLCNDVFEDHYFTYAWSPKLYEDILQCIQDGKNHYLKDVDEPDSLKHPGKTQIGYFVILTDDHLVTELHANVL